MYSNQMINGPVLPMVFAWFIESMIFYFVLGMVEEWMLNTIEGKFGKNSLTIRIPKVVLFILVVLIPIKTAFAIPVLAGWNLFITKVSDSDVDDDDIEE